MASSRLAPNLERYRIDYEWSKEHPLPYPGEWVGVFKKKVVAHSTKFTSFIAQLEEKGLDPAEIFFTRIRGKPKKGANAFPIGKVFFPASKEMAVQCDRVKKITKFLVSTEEAYSLAEAIESENKRLRTEFVVSGGMIKSP